MKRVESYEELSKLIFSQWKKEVMTNSFLKKETWIQEIEEKKLFYRLGNGYLLLFRKREDFYILNYYWNMPSLEELKEALEVSQKIVVEIVGKEEWNIQYQKQLEIWKELKYFCILKRERFQKRQIADEGREKGRNTEEKSLENYLNDGIQVVDNRLQVASDKIQAVDNRSQVVNDKIQAVDNRLQVAGDKIQVVDNKGKMADNSKKIVDFLKKNFSPITGCIPSLNQLKQDMAKGYVLQASIGEDIIGVLHFQQNGNNAEIKHLAVDEAYRGRKIAARLLENYEKRITAKQQIVWTGTENQKAQKLYQKFGYQKDGFVASVYQNMN